MPDHGQERLAMDPRGSIASSEEIGEFSPAAIMSAVPGRLVSTTGVPCAIAGNALDALKEDVRAAERAGATAPGAALSIAAWQQAGERSRWALGFERRHGAPPALSDYMARKSEEPSDASARLHARQAAKNDVKEKGMADIEQKRVVHLSFHENFVREGIPYTDKATGEQRTFNQVRIPSGTIIGGQDMGGYEFSPLYVNASRFKGPKWRDVPMLADREVWLQKSVLDPEVNPVLDEAGRCQKDTVKVMPQQIKEALAESRRAWAEKHGRDDRGLDQRAEQARGASGAMEQVREAIPAASREQR